MFKPGDRVVVVSTGRLGDRNYEKYVGATGTLARIANNSNVVVPDKESMTLERPCAYGEWWFNRTYFKLELIDSEQSFIPEDWT